MPCWISGSRLPLLLLLAGLAAGHSGAPGPEVEQTARAPLARTMPREAIFTPPPLGNQCGPSGLVGGSETVKLPDPTATAMSEAALASYLKAADANSAAAGCSPAGPVQVTSACRQVVAGANWRLAFTAPLGLCAGPDASKEAVLQAQVFEPLPYTNAAPAVNEVTATCVRVQGSAC